MAGNAGALAAVFDNLSAITRDTYLDGLIDQIYDSNPLIKRLRAKADFVNGGEAIRQPLLYAKNTAKGSYSGFDLLDTQPTEKIANSVLPWAHYYVNITIAHTDLLKNMNSDAGIISLLETELASAELDMGDQLGTGVYDNGSDGDGIVGLREALGTGRTYAGINSSVYSWWNAQTVTTTHSLADLADSTDAQYIITAFRDMMGNCTIGRDHPTLICVTQSVWNILWSEIFDKTTYFIDGMHPDLTDIGFRAFDFMGAAVVVDSHVPVGFAFVLNEKYLSLKVHPDDDFYFEEFQKPTNQRVHIAKLFWSGQLTCSNPRMNGIFTDFGAS